MGREGGLWGRVRSAGACARARVRAVVHLLPELVDAHVAQLRLSRGLVGARVGGGRREAELEAHADGVEADVVGLQLPRHLPDLVVGGWWWWWW